MSALPESDICGQGWVCAGGEIGDHRPVVERRGGHDDFRPAVMAVQIRARTFIVQEPVSVGELDDLGDFIHGKPEASTVVDPGSIDCIDLTVPGAALSRPATITCQPL